jgi:hypothetical protein
MVVGIAELVFGIFLTGIGVAAFLVHKHFMATPIPDIPILNDIVQIPEPSSDPIHILAMMAGEDVEKFFPAGIDKNSLIETLPPNSELLF